MKKLLLFFLFIVSLIADEIQTYGGFIDVSGKLGNYKGVIYKSLSEDETIEYKLGLKRLDIYRNDITQTETYIAIKQETDLDKHIEFVFQNIKNKINDGNLYSLNFYKNDAVDYKVGLNFSTYTLDEVYQLSMQFNSFLGNTPFYINPSLYLIKVKDDGDYESVNLKMGYVYSRHDLYFSVLLGENRYLVSDDLYYSCNFGYITKINYKVSYAYQLNRNLILKTSYYHYDIKSGINYINAYNLALSYKY